MCMLSLPMDLHSTLSTESAAQDHCQQPSIDISAQSSDPNSQPTNTFKSIAVEADSS